jgi:RimJ/RimL family protein N-acetyltransferase
MTVPSATFDLATVGFSLAAGLVPWDTEIFGFSVAQIHDITVEDAAKGAEGWRSFGDWLAIHDVKVISCRLPMDRLRESMFLESEGFRFIEVVLHPYLDNLDRLTLPPSDLIILPAEHSDLPSLIDLAERAFRHERYHVDPRLDPRLGDLRYGRWVRASLRHPSQQLLKILHGTHLIGFFVLEEKEGGAVYWHLNAISPDFHGQGYGRRVWQALLRRHQDAGTTSISTTISVRNIAVQNLYAQLGFRFRTPEMTFHWVTNPRRRDGFGLGSDKSTAEPVLEEAR